MIKMMTVIVCVDSDGGISKNGKIPWTNEIDVRFFMETTRGHYCIMGNKTREDILSKPNGHRFFENRNVIVLTKTQNYFSDAKTANSIEDAVELIPDPEKEYFICGGEGVYNEVIHYADKVIITKLKESYKCDKFFPMKCLENNFVLQKTVGFCDNSFSMNYYVKN